jgi:uncharacterized protein (TIGR03437 family)
VTIQASADAAGLGLSAGVYHGTVTAEPSNGPVQELEVVLIVVPAGTFLQRELPRAAACTAVSLELVATTIGNGLSLPVSFPRPVLAQVVDNCGTPVNNASVVATIEGLVIGLGHVGGGQYSGTWTPTQESASVAVSLTATHPTLGSAQRNYSLATAAAAGGIALPVLSSDGVVEGAGFTLQRPLAPGAIVAISGNGFASGTQFAAAVPLPTNLGGVSVLMGGENAPLYSVSPTQIFAQVPFTAQVGESMSILVNANGQLTEPQNYLIAPVQPGIFSGAVIDVQNGAAVSATRPAQIGHELIIYSNGLGRVEQEVGTGQASPQAQALLPVTVEIGGAAVPVSYAGLTPGFVGLDHVRVTLTGAVPTGNDIPVVIKQNGIQSNPDLPILLSIQ